MRTRPKFKKAGSLTPGLFLFFFDTERFRFVVIMDADLSDILEELEYVNNKIKEWE